MRRFLILATIAAVAGGCCQKAEGPVSDPVSYVNTLCGTASTYELSTGNTYPAVAVPWGMNFWTPQTGKNGDGWTYRYDATKIRGLKQTHQPSPWINDYGEFSLMPVTTGPVWDEEARQSWFSHKAETAKPYYYSVYLAEHDVFAEVTPTSHAAAIRLTYPQKDMSYLVVDAYHNGSYVKVLPGGNTIVGYTTLNHGGVTKDFKNWFVIESDTPFQTVSTVTDGVVRQESEASGGHALALVGFRTARGQKVNLKVASSFISLEQAMVNLGEVKDKDFDTVCSEAHDIWNQTLGRIAVEDKNVDHLRTFYSCLYRSLLFPRDLSEVTADGKRVHYSPFDGQIHDGYLFGDTGFWDTFRCLFPLMNLVYPDQSAKVQEGLVNTWKESGFLPEWASPGHRNCMVGNNSASVVADAYVKGIRGYDARALWDAVVSGAHSSHPDITSTGRAGWQQYDALGYVPNDCGLRETAARTLEYAYDDWCIWRLGKALGIPDEETEPYLKSASNYKNLFDPEFRLMNGKNSKGEFRRPFSPVAWGGDFTEGNSLHYTWSVFHDVAGLMNLMGGAQDFEAMLDGVFEMPPVFDDSYYGFVIHEIREMQIMNMGNYAHGNQPIQHMLYLYDWAGTPWKTQARVREVMEKFYTSNFDGYCGDEDNGQTSAWYVFSALGFYPVCPASDQYALGTPLFDKVTVTRPDGKFTITAKGNGPQNFYVSSLKVDGSSWEHNYLRHSDLVSGKNLVFTMSDQPSLSRGVKDENRPYSMSDEQ